MKENFFAYISRMRYIGRWSLMRNSLPENIQEHSHMVAVLAHALGVIRRDIFHVPCNPDEAATVALFHDSSEILTGDLPTPIKYHSNEIRDAYKQVEELACHKLLDTLPKELRGAYEPLLNGETEERVHDLVKAADKLSAYIKCIEERKAGNNEFLSGRSSKRATCRRWTISSSTSFRPLSSTSMSWGQLNNANDKSEEMKTEGRFRF